MSTVQSPVAGPVKERILVVAQRLFAQGGFSRYGVRDIAREAQVSVSMVSYHFGGKLGILRSIFASFFDQYTQVVESSLAGASDLEQKVECLVRETTRFMKAHENVFRIVATELPHFPDEVAEFERIYLEMIRRLTQRWFSPELFGAHGSTGSTGSVSGDGCADEETMQTIVGPALLSMIYSTFLFGRSLEKAFCFTRDDAYYAQYEKLVARLILAGIREVAPGP